MKRRDFLKTTGVACGASTLGALLHRPLTASERTISFVVDPGDPVASSPAATWALGRLRRALDDAGFATRVLDRLERTRPGDVCVVCGDSSSPAAAAAIEAACEPMPAGAEQLALVAARRRGVDHLLVAGSDPRGLTYGLLDLADRIASGTPALSALTGTRPTVQAPANPVRSVMRQFTSEVLDKGWFNDREMWPQYLDLLASSRFNRLHLAFGLGYDSLQRVADSYFVFLYPFLIKVPSYDVRVTNLSDAERDRNLEMLRWIGEQTVAHGLTFQLGIWMHGYALADSPQAKYVVEGLTPATHAAYCRDALTAVLRACPAISAVALRIHGESGVAEGSYDFWQTVFDGVARAGRSIEIDLHSKGLDHTMIDRALATGMPVNVSPKYWAEHLGMPYHQAAIRGLEMPVAGRTGNGLMTLSEGTLSFTRYGYADFLDETRKYTVRHRVFAGTQRLLLAADPENAAAYARAFGFCGSTGMDLMEPLTCRGRRGTGIEGTARSGYADKRLEPKWDWQKYTAWYRAWGRLTFDPTSGAEAVRREFPSGAAGSALASALARASRVLPIITTAYLPSAACDAYWPEVYWNQPLAAEPRPNPYGDTPAPKTFQHASPIDPQLFTTMTECAEELVTGKRSGRYSPLDAALWLDDLAGGIQKELATAGRASTPETERVAIDIGIQAGLARFFAEKFRAGVLYAVHERTSARAPLDASIARYRAARAAWAALSQLASVYAADLSASDRLSERGQWSDRMSALDADIDRLSKKLASMPAATNPAADAFTTAVLQWQSQPAARCAHKPAATFKPGDSVTLRVTVDQPGTANVTCFYRHVNQSDRFVAVDMTRSGNEHTATIPADYTRSNYPLLYYFVVNQGTRDAALYPGLGEGLRDQPYFVMRRA